MGISERVTVCLGALFGVRQTPLERAATAVAERLGRWADRRYLARFTAELEAQRIYLDARRPEPGEVEAALGIDP